LRHSYRSCFVVCLCWFIVFDSLLFYGDSVFIEVLVFFIAYFDFISTNSKISSRRMANAEGPRRAFLSDDVFPPPAFSEHAALERWATKCAPGYLEQLLA
ncbi:unnamed protein product, partial [Amoebophrya sp. A120]